MKHLHIDIESFSAADLISVGTYAYAAHASTEVMLLAYALGDNDVKLIDLTADPVMPQPLLDAMTNPHYLKIAFNAPFERALLSEVLYIPCQPEQWACTSVLAREHGLPGSLAGAGAALGIEKAKHDGGKKLIRMFSLPQKDRKTGEMFRHDRHSKPAEWEQFKAYCIQDVEAEREIWERLHG